MFSQQKNIRLFWDLFFPVPTNNFATQFIICTSSVDMLGLRLDIFIKHARDKRGLFTVFACVCVCVGVYMATLTILDWSTHTRSSKSKLKF